MRIRITAFVVALTALFGIGAMASPASAAPGHQTIGCNVGVSSGWTQFSLGGEYVAEGCLSVYDHGSHVDVTYWGYDGSLDGWDIDVYRNLSWVNDGWVKVASCSGFDTYCSSNKQYDDVTATRSASLRITADRNGTTYTLGEIGPIYW